MRHEDQRGTGSGIQFKQELGNLHSRGRVQITGRLICEQNAGLVDERTGQCHPLLLAPRQLRRIMVESLRQSDPSQQLASAFLSPGSALQFGRNQNVLERGEGR